MELNYNPFFDPQGVPEIPENGIVFGVKTVNTGGLLDELMLRAGMGFGVNPAGKRIIGLIEKLHGDNPRVWSKSFEIDPTGVAKAVIEWRDSILMEFKLEELKGISKRIDDIIELSDKILPASADAWKALEKAFEDSSARPFNATADKINVAVPQTLVPKTVRNVLAGCGAKVEYGKTPRKAEHQKVTIYKTARLSDAYEWAVSEDLSKATVINSDNRRLNSVLRSKGKATGASRTEAGTPAAISLMKTGLTLLQRPLNINVLLAYLQTYKNPIPAKTRFSLARALACEGGFGKKWEEIRNAQDSDIQSIKTWLDPLISDGWDNDNIPTELVSNYLHKLTMQEKELTDYCEILTNHITKRGKSIAFSELSNILEGMCTGVQFISEEARLGCMKTTDSPLALAGKTEKLVWLDCCGDGSPKYPLDFLTSIESSKILERNEDFVMRETYAKEYQNCLSCCLGAADELILFSPASDLGDMLQEHPSVTELLNKGVTSETPAIPEYSGPVAGFTTPAQLEFGKNIIGKFSRTESQNSIGKLIDCPFDYFTDYVLGMPDPSELQLKNVKITKGDVAHLFMEKLVADCKEDIGKMEKMLDEEFDTRIQEAIREKGIVLLLKENHTELVIFRNTLKNSVKALIAILKANGLTPVECESKFPEGFTMGEPIGLFGGSVDFITRTKEGHIVIIDFKWSDRNTYRDLLKENNAIQLELYRVAVEKKLQKTVDAVGYWLFPKMKLYTCGYLKGDNVVIVKPKQLDRKLIDIIEEKVRNRHGQMEEGTIEMPDEKAEWASHKVLKDKLN